MSSGGPGLQVTRDEHTMDVTRICSELVRIRSDNPPGETEEIIHYIMGLLESIGLPSELIRSRGGRCNLVSRNEGSKLLLCGHVDVVPALAEGWTHPPFSGLITHDAVHGRGSSDMKGGCAAIIAACATLADSSGPPCIDLAFVCDEETGGRCGIQHLIAHKVITPKDCLIAEPTPEHHPNIGQKGLCRLTLDFRGVPGHGSLYPMRGTSAIMEAYRLLGKCDDIHRKIFQVGEPGQDLIENSARVLSRILGIPDAGSVLTRVMYNPGTIRGGEKANVIAQQCELELEFRLPWGYRSDDLFAELLNGISTVTVRKKEYYEPSLTSPDHPLVQRLLGCVSRVAGGEASPIVSWAASDARHLRALGCPVVEYGPGDPSVIHAVDEKVPREALSRSVTVYSDLIREYKI